MLVGMPPFFDQKKEKMFQNIKTGPLKMPTKISPVASDFICQLLNKNPMKRLGAGKMDVEELKSHEFFAGINWDEVLERKLEHPRPPI